ncbi:MAG TPA: UbiA prenyltransferase family protein [Candidatus Woesebacteria bacterium]|nr:UbiA prenyltransferase family protein [Candidatus Woesebacteria bacterium]HNS94730.1 UbiA prenyltransferase family protein [Candidatus Woesebacteria bacterium]
MYNANKHHFLPLFFMYTSFALHIIRTMRVNQWTKNLVVFVAIIFSGKLFDAELFARSLVAFCVFCLLSSAAYIMNDLVDAPADRRHPVKKNRPIASGEISTIQGLLLLIFLVSVALLGAILFDIMFFMLAVGFLLWQVMYSFILKSFAVIDIFAISFSFVIRALAGMLVTGFHIPVWLFLTIFFMSLFIASIKRNAELALAGSDARHTLSKYNQNFLNFLIYTFSTATIIAYCLYSYIEQPPYVLTPVSIFFSSLFPGFEGRKLMTLTIPVVVYAIARYGQLFYTRIEGERPDKVVVSDVPLMMAMAVWGVMIIVFIYLL